MNMKTDELIAFLSTQVEPVDRRQLVRSIGMAVGISAATAIAVMLAVFGPRTDVWESHALGYLLLKLLFTVGIVVPGTIYLARLSRPGGERRIRSALLAVPFIAIILLGALALCFAPTAHWNRMIVGDQWLECLLSIPIIAIVPFAILVWVVRKTAPTDLTRAGAFIGLTAGAISATGYALHCVDDSLPFIALWYGGTIALCTLAGAMLGPRLLRW
jgi:hypothetical protein